MMVSVVATHMINNPNDQGKVMGMQIGPSPTAIPSSTPMPTITPIPTATPRPTPRPTPRATPTPTSIPQPTFTSEQIYDMINQYAGQYGVSPDVMRYMAVCETGFNPKATNHQYAGLFQFDSDTWERFRKLMGKDPNPDLRYNAQETVMTTAYMLSIGRAALWPNCYPK